MIIYNKINDWIYIEREDEVRMLEPNRDERD